MVQSKQELNVNGEHTKLGREFSMAEFKGFTAAKIDSMEKILCQIQKDSKENTRVLHERINIVEKDINDLQAFKNKVLGLAIAAGAVAGVIGQGILNFWNNLPWK